MAGEFRISKNFQISSCIVLIVSMTVCGIQWGVYGLLVSVLLVAVLLAILEIGYVHIYFFKGKMACFFRMALPYLLTGLIAAVFEKQLAANVDGLMSFICYGFLIVLMNLIFALLIGFIFERRIMLNLAKRILGLLQAKKGK